ncbi:MAG: isoprenylcysteine carboxylmethyltransferase family protein [Desulfobulbus sp.]
MDFSLNKQIDDTISSNWAIRWRHPVSMAVILVCALILLITPPHWSPQSLGWHIADSLGFILVVIAAFGRIWCSLYISGYKEDRVVAEGPYAIVRNPLYVFSFIGAIGLGLITQHLVVPGIIALAFLLYYPLVVRGEEQVLGHKFGPLYDAYKSSVPRFLPRRFRLVEPDTYPLRLRHVRRSMQEIMGFFWAYLILKWAVEIHYTGWLHNFSFS